MLLIQTYLYLLNQYYLLVYMCVIIIIKLIFLNGFVNHSFESRFAYKKFKIYIYTHVYIIWNYSIIYFIIFFVCLSILNNYNKFNLNYKTKNKNLQINKSTFYISLFFFKTIFLWRCNFSYRYWIIFIHFNYTNIYRFFFAIRF